MSLLSFIRHLHAISFHVLNFDSFANFATDIYSSSAFSRYSFDVSEFKGFTATALQDSRVSTRTRNSTPFRMIYVPNPEPTGLTNFCLHFGMEHEHARALVVPPEKSTRHRRAPNIAPLLSQKV
jgi:hypothetical protein